MTKAKVNKVKQEKEEHGLSKQHLAFCVDYLSQPPESRSGTKSAINAGYSEKTAHVQGSRLLKNAKIKDFITKEEGKVVKRLETMLIMSRQKQLEKLESICKTCMQLEPVTVRDEIGEMMPIGIFKNIDPKSAISAIVEQNKMMGYNVPENKITDTVFNFNFGIQEDDKSLLDES